MSKMSPCEPSLPSSPAAASSASALSHCFPAGMLPLPPAGPPTGSMVHVVLPPAAPTAQSDLDRELLSITPQPVLDRPIQVGGGFMKVPEVPPSKLPAPASMRFPVPAAPSSPVIFATTLATAVLASRKANLAIGGHMACAHRLSRPVAAAAPPPLPTVPAAMAGGAVIELQPPLASVHAAMAPVAADLPPLHLHVPVREKSVPAAPTLLPSPHLWPCQNCVSQSPSAPVDLAGLSDSIIGGHMSVQEVSTLRPGWGDWHGCFDRDATPAIPVCCAPAPPEDLLGGWHTVARHHPLPPVVYRR